MRRRLAGTVALAVLTTLAVPTRARAVEMASTLVQTDAGPVRGKIDGDVLSFQGIPFAKPPLGSLRWRAPQPPAPWTEPVDASSFRADCMQPSSADASPRPSEDCLYVNVWRRAAAGGRPLPVLVWIPGGGLVKGGASQYPVAALVKRGIVVVSFNYRVGRFGFFAHPALAAESPADPRGNYGYMDQIAALKWVQHNIAAFGGDPAHVTIAGVAAGGGSVLVLLTSPMANGLFHRAILQSPAIPGPRENATPMRSLEDAEKIAVDYAHSLGIKDDGAAGLADLRLVPAKKLGEGVENTIDSIFGGPDVPGLSHSILDGRLVPEAPERTLKAGRQAKVPVLVGATSAELAYSTAKSKDELFATFGPRAGRARELYDPDGTAELSSVVQAVMSDGAMVEPTRFLAAQTAKAGEPAYFYRFAYIPESREAEARGAAHASDVPFMLDAVRLFLGDRTTEADEYMATTMSAYWSAFVRTGNPSVESRPQWPRYDPDKEEVFQFVRNGPANGPDPRKDRLDFWEVVREETPAGGMRRP